MTRPAVMVDIETLGKLPTSAFTSIGACLFEPHSDWIGETFHMHVSLENATRTGLTMDASTLLWWLGQTNRARKTLANGQHDAAPLITALDAFAAFLPPEAEIWCNGASFDLPILNYAYHLIGMKTPWEYYNERDLRTLKGLKKRQRTKLTRLKRAGTHHNALDDAVHQAKLVQHILQLNPDMDS